MNTRTLFSFKHFFRNIDRALILFLASTHVNFYLALL